MRSSSLIPVFARVLALFVVSVLLCSCMPSSLILSAARNERGVLSRDHNRTRVEKTLGKPVWEEAVPAIELSTLKFPKPASKENYRERNFLHGYEGDGGLDPKQSHLVVAHCRYVVSGKFIPHGYAGDANAMGFMTLGLTEIIAIPMAIAEVTPHASIENTFDVWYSQEAHVLAYTWTWIEKKKAPASEDDKAK